MLEFQHFHAAEAWWQVLDQLTRQLLRPIDLHHAWQYWRFREVTAEVRQIQWHHQLQLPFTILLHGRQWFHLGWPWLGQHRFDGGLGQLALTVIGQLREQAPTAGQGDGFAMTGQVATQGFGDGLAPFIAQRMQAGWAQGYQGAEVGTAFLQYAEARIAEPCVAA